MTTHLTVRMAWHDNKWNGNVCLDPQSNHYCTGTHSLLSQRLNKKKDKDIEGRNAGKKLDSIPGYLPPCFWSSSAFSSSTTNIVHIHPFPQFKDRIISETMDPYSTYSWPFRFSFNHGDLKKNAQGSYRSNLRDTVSRYCDKFEAGQSIVFFYLNYDNPVSAEENKYALVGFSVLNKKPELTKDFPISNEEESKTRNANNDMKNFSKLNWALKISYDFQKQGVRIPYHEYIRAAKDNPAYWKLLEEIKVLIDEGSMSSDFKYVMSDIDEDQTILLLSKLKKVARRINEHGIVNFSNEEKIIDDVLKGAWRRRGRYPGIGKILDYIITKNGTGNEIVKTLSENNVDDANILSFTFDIILKNSMAIPSYLQAFSQDIKNLRRNIVQFTSVLPLMKKLSLFDFKVGQLEDILAKKSHFKRRPENKEIVDNPYVLCEEYDYSVTDEDRDKEVITNGPIDIFKIDIGMFSDQIFGFDEELQNLTPFSKERIRPLIMEYLRRIGKLGDCFSGTSEIYNFVIDNPFFYEEKAIFNEEQLLEEEYISHFSKKLIIQNSDGKAFFYLQEVKRAEDVVRETIIKLLDNVEHKSEIADIEYYLQDSYNKIVKRGLESLDIRRFKEERRPILEKVPKKSFFIISGSAGTGKSKLLQKLVSHFEENDEKTVILTPTGKAAIRLKKDAGLIQSQTIDHFVRSTGQNNSKILNEFQLLLQLKPEKYHVGNLIIDECSMVDLHKLSTVFNLIEINGSNGVRRIILVGDENQLPPIGFGRPFYDSIQYLKERGDIRDAHYAKLLTNCRMHNDQLTLQVADAFTDSKYYNEALDNILLNKNIITEEISLLEWEDYGDLNLKISAEIESLAGLNIIKSTKSPPKHELIFSLFNLHPTGYVKEGNCEGVDNFQMLSPFKAGVGGVLSLNGFMEEEYTIKDNSIDKIKFKTSEFYHGEKIINTENEYKWDNIKKEKTLRLTNGSIGVINNKKNSNGSMFRAFFFTDQENAIYGVKEDILEPAYAISVHKSQGSDFKAVFIILPDSTQRISRELFYTAITRSKEKVRILIPSGKRKEIIENIRNHSEVLHRNTSLFIQPGDYKKYFHPSEDVRVRSKIEYIIYKKLEDGGINFKYEEPLDLNAGKKIVRIKPDFTLKMPDGRTLFWEHLGELDVKEYSLNWKNRYELYRENNIADAVISTDDLGGVYEEILEKLVNDIKNNNFLGDNSGKFSKHHYRLYP